MLQFASGSYDTFSNDEVKTFTSRPRHFLRQTTQGGGKTEAAGSALRQRETEAGQRCRDQMHLQKLWSLLATSFPRHAEFGATPGNLLFSCRNEPSCGISFPQKCPISENSLQNQSIYLAF